MSTKALAARNNRPLRQSSSLVLNAPDPTPKDKSPTLKDASRSRTTVSNSSESEVIPDSEEEMKRLYSALHPPKQTKTAVDEEVIEIITTDDEALGPPPSRPPPSNTLRRATPLDRPSDVTPRKPPKVPKTPRSRRIILSSSSESEAEPLSRSCPVPPVPSNDVIVISDSSDEEDISPRGRQTTPKQPLIRSEPPAQETEDPWARDESILELNEPRTARKPIPRTTAKTKPSKQHPKPNVVGSSTSDSMPLLHPSSDDEGFTAVADPSPTPPTEPRSARPPSSSGSSRPPKTQSTSPGTDVLKTPRARKGKKAEAAAEQIRREAYAQTLFDDLNASVFKGELPQTKLVWSKRLLTTAGRAKWHRSKTGVDTTEIELAMKILDCDQRIRNTLSHEMCHLASWLISKEPKEHHGRIFKSWATKVMKKRRDIEVTTRHNYDIVYAYEWKCSDCGKIYGRHSKSINPDEVLCGACKTGRLVPQFERRGGATPRAKSRTASRNAGPSRDSPRTPKVIPGAFGVDSDSDSDGLAELLKGLNLPDLELD